MTTTEISAEIELRDLVTLPSRVVSVYFRRPIGEESTAARRHAVVTRLAGDGVDAANLRALDDLLCDVRPGRGAVALFSGACGRPRVLDMPGADTPDSAACSTLPDLLPLLAWRQSRPAYVVAALNRSGADVAVCPAAGGEPERIEVVGLDDEIAGNAPEGRSQDRFRHRVEDSWLHNAARDADAITDALARSGARLLLVAGDVRTVGLMLEQLPAWVRQETVIHKVSGGRSQDGSQGLRAGQIAAEVAEAARGRTRALLEEFAAHAGPDGLAVQGGGAVLHALARGRVRTLLVTQNPDDERVVWFGERPTELSGHRGDLKALGRPVQRGRLVDAAVRAAILTDADVHVLQPGTFGAPAQGIGALCRFR